MSSQVIWPYRIDLKPEAGGQNMLVFTHENACEKFMKCSNTENDFLTLECDGGVVFSVPVKYVVSVHNIHSHNLHQIPFVKEMERKAELAQKKELKIAH